MNIERPRGWRRLESSLWSCLECERQLPGGSGELVYIADMDYVYHIHNDAIYRVIKIKPRKDGIQVSLPGVEFNESNPNQLSITGVSAGVLETADLNLYTKSAPKQKQSFQTIEDTERIKTVIESHPSGISRKNIARLLKLSEGRVQKLVRKILESDSNIQETKKGKEILLKAMDSTPAWWKSLKNEIE